VFVQARLPGAWFAWRGLQEQGYRAEARDGPVVQLRPSAGAPQDPPVPEPDRSRPIYCDGWYGDVTATPDAIIWLWGSGEARIGVAAPEGVTVEIAVDGGDPRRADPATTIELGTDGWHAIEVRGSPGVRVTVA
jgi:hypothetical protein